MIFKPYPLSGERLSAEELTEDKKGCKKFGPCGVGKKAIYLNSFYFSRRYYVPLDRVTRVFKRVAMSKGGFSQKGMFASIPYLVVVYDGGKEKQCNFKYEEQVDQLLAYLEKEHPGIRTLSAPAEERLHERERSQESKKASKLSEAGGKCADRLLRAEEFLEKRPDLYKELQQAARAKRAYLRSNPSYRWVAFAITCLGAVSLVYGIFTFLRKGQFAVYFVLFGIAAIFLFAGFSVLPTARNNRKSVMQRNDNAELNMGNYLKGYGAFPVPAYYAHPVVLRRMRRAVEEGRAESMEDALEVVKQDLKALNSSVEVEQEEYDEVTAIKPMFLNHAYQ